MTSDDRRPPDDSAYPEGDESMSDLESADEYVRAQDFIENLRADRRPVREASSEHDARLHETAALLHAAVPESATVDPTFATRLLARLEAEQRRSQPTVGAVQAQATPTTAATSADVAPARQTRRTGVSRRGLVWGGLGAAAAALTGAAITAALEQPNHTTTIPPAGALVPAGAGKWVAIATLAAAPLGSVKRFEAGAVIGYLQHTASGFKALSGVCTHMACLLQWNASGRTFDCPCHGVQFLTSGDAAPGAPYTYAPLPVIETKVEADQVWVYVAASAASPQAPQAAATATTRNYDVTAGPPSK
jgi:Rieske Fe-S protein